MNLSHEEINRVFLELDNSNEILAIQFKGWMAWPLVKANIWHYVFAHTYNQGAPSREKKEPSLIQGLGLGLYELTLNLVFPLKTETAILFSPRKISDGKGGSIHPHFGKFIRSDQSQLHIVYEWGRKRKETYTNRGIINEKYSGLLFSAIGRLSRGSTTIHQTAKALANEIVKVKPILQYEIIYDLCKRTLSRFSIKYLYYKALFSKSGINKVFVTDPDMKSPEIAAAKSLGITVCEIQHGMFGPNDPDYSWTYKHNPYRSKMVVPDKIMVFGTLWRNALLSNGFWTKNELICIGNAAVHYRRRTMASKKRNQPLKVLFPSQYYVREEALNFWGIALNEQNKQEKKLFELLIAVHPSEEKKRHIYLNFASRHITDCTVLDERQDGFDSIDECDVIAGYESFMLLEGAAMNRPVISICGKASPNGIASTFMMPALNEIIHHISEPQQFLKLLMDIYVQEISMRPSQKHIIFTEPSEEFEDALQKL